LESGERVAAGFRGGKGREDRRRLPRRQLRHLPRGDQDRRRGIPYLAGRQRGGRELFDVYLQAEVESRNRRMNMFLSSSFSFSSSSSIKAGFRGRGRERGRGRQS